MDSFQEKKMLLSAYYKLQRFTKDSIVILITILQPNWGIESSVSFFSNNFYNKTAAGLISTINFGLVSNVNDFSKYLRILI